MAKSKKNGKKPSVKVQDLGAKDNPKGGTVKLKDTSFQKVLDKTSPLTSSSSVKITSTALTDKWIK